MQNLSNNKIKEIKKLHLKKYRDESGFFMAEGEKPLEEILNSNIEIIDIYSVKKLNINLPKIKYISEEEMKKISTTSSVCEVLTIAKQKYVNKKDFFKLNKIALIENISDPGNLGTIIRSACAFGIEGIILFGDCVELYSPKVIRSSAGNFFKIPVAQIKNISDIKENFPQHAIISTSPANKNNINMPDCAKINKCIIMFGSEAKGLSENILKIADKNISLKMCNNVESLNLAVCASIIFYELQFK